MRTRWYARLLTRTVYFANKNGALLTVSRCSMDVRQYISKARGVISRLRRVYGCLWSKHAKRGTSADIFCVGYSSATEFMNGRAYPVVMNGGLRLT